VFYSKFNAESKSEINFPKIFRKIPKKVKNPKINYLFAYNHTEAKSQHKYKYGIRTREHRITLTKNGFRKKNISKKILGPKILKKSH
jgi:hypothetical protein